MTSYLVRSTGGTDIRVRLDDSDYVASGGEKDVYAKGDVAYCIYHDSGHAVPTGKIHELSLVNHPGFIAPEALLLSDKGNRVGETMPFVPDRFVLCELFASGLRKSQNVTHKTDLSVLSQMFDIANAAHKAGVVLVDPNDMNWLVSKKFDSTCLVDTATCQTKSFPGTAIKPAIRDPFAKQWSPESDYYSLAVLAAWLWTGIHPFCVGFKVKSTMTENQKACRSILHKDALLNPAVRPFNDMPRPLLDWLQSHFGSMKDRPALPAISGLKVTATQPTTHIVPQHGSVTWEVLNDAMWKTPGTSFDFQTGQSLCIEKDMLHVGSLSINLPNVSTHDGVAYQLQGDTWYRLSFRTVNGALRTSNQLIAKIANLPHATTIGDGCIVQDMLGKKVVHADGLQLVLNLPKHKVLSATAHGNVVMLTTKSSKKLWRITASTLLETPLIEEISTGGSPVFCVLKKGILIENRDGELIVRSLKDTSNKKTGAIPAEMELLTDGVRVLGRMRDTGYQIKLR